MTRRLRYLVALAALGLASCAPHRSEQAAAGWVSPSVARSGWFTTSDGVRLHYLEAGAGRPIVFVPGWLMPADIWEPQLRGLAGRYRVVALDPRSQGASAHASGGHYQARRAEDVRELIEHLRLDGVTLVGWSLAVPEVLSYVNRYGTSRLAALVLVDGGVWAARVDTAARLKTLGEIQRDPERYLDRFVRGMYATPQPEAYLRHVVDAARRTPVDAAIALNFDLFFGPERDHRAALDRIDRPVLYVDARRRSSHADTLVAHVPAARVELFAESGHALFVDAADRFNALLDEFVRAR